MTFRSALLGLSTTAACIAGSAGVAVAAPYCYETGPGHQKCIGGNSSSDYFEPIYQGPKIFDSGVMPWVPPVYNSPAPPITAPVNPVDLLARQVLSDIQGRLDTDPGQSQFNVRVLNVSLVRTGDTTFEGVATMTAMGSPPRDIPVHVFSDNGTPSWKIDPGAMAALIPA